MKKSNWVKILLFLILAVLVNFIARLTNVQWDLTEDKRYTLSTEAKSALRATEGPIVITVLLEGNIPSSFRAYREYIDFYLSEMSRYDNDVEIIYKNPNEGTDANGFKEYLRKQGIDGVSRQVGSQDEVSKSLLFPYVSIHDENGIRFIDLLEALGQNESEASALLRSQFKLESKILRALQSLKSNSSKAVHVIGPRNELLAEGYNRDKRINNNRFVASNGRNILESIDAISAILCVTNQDIAREDILAIDVATQRGVPVIWLIDKFDITLDSLSATGSALGLHNDLNIEDYLFKLGVKIEPQLVQDLSCSPIPQVTGSEGGKAKKILLPYPYHIIVRSNKATSLAAKTGEPVHLKYVSPISVGRQLDGLNYSPLVTSSEYSALKKSPVALNFEMMRVQPNPNDYNVGNIVLGLEIEGKIPRYFGKRMSAEERKMTMRYLNADDIASSSRQVIIGDASFASPTQGRNGRYYPIGFNTWDQQMYEGNMQLLSNLLDFLLLGLPILLIVLSYIIYGYFRRRKYENYKI